MQNKYDFLYKLDLDQNVIDKISLNLDRVSSGSSTPLRSPLGLGLDSDQILSGWDDIFNSSTRELSEELLTLELSNRLKYGPRSIAVPWIERREGVLDYFSSESSNISITDKSYAHLRPRLRPLSPNKVINFIKNSTSSGLPFMVDKREVKDICLKNFDSLLDRKDNCIMFTRTQESLKTRTVWGYPIADVINESRFYRPLLEYQKRLPWRSSLVGPERVDESITILLNKAVSLNQLLLSIDFSAYDSSAKTTLQTQAFDYIKRLFQPKYHHEIDYIQERFNSIGLITPEGVMKGAHGVPSGSTFTNEVDSIIQYLVASPYVGSDRFDIQGDDGVYVTDDPISLKDAFRRSGLNINDSKSFISDRSVVYLQNLHSLDYIKDNKFVGIYPTYRALNRIIFPERFHNYSDYSIEGSDFNSIRTITILENCRHHPLFEELVKYICKLDKYGLAYSQSGLTKYIQRLKSTSGVEGIFAYRRGDQLSGLNRFETVKLLSRL